MAEPPNLMSLSDPSADPTIDFTPVLTAIAELQADVDSRNDAVDLAAALSAIANLQADLDTSNKAANANLAAVQIALSGLASLIANNQVQATNQYDQLQAGLTSAVTQVAADLATIAGSLDLLSGRVVDIMTAIKASGGGGGGGLADTAGLVTLIENNQAQTTSQINQLQAGLTSAVSQTAANQATLVAELGLLSQRVVDIIVGLADLQAVEANTAATMAQILAAINANAPPTRIMLDLAHGTHKPQAIPQRPGP